jgi:predicted kinase
MAIDQLHAFYCSKAYLDLSLMLKVQSGGRCANGCTKIFDIQELRTHHIVELNAANVNDPTIALNPANIKVICHDCHNREHRRFGGQAGKRVFLVWGAPCAGKSQYVAQVATRYDVVVDLDRLHKAITVCDIYDKPEATKREAFDLRDLLLDRIRTRSGKWECAYIVGMYPDRSERERMAGEYGAELVHIDTPKEECIRRAYEDEAREAVRQETIGYIKRYFERLRT